MDIRIKSTDYQITPEVSEYLDGRLAGIEKLLADDAFTARCEVELGRDSGQHRRYDNMWMAEVQVFYDGEHVRATNHASTINAAIDDVKEEVERQIRKSKKTHIRFLRKGGAALKRLMRFGGQ